MNSGISYNTSKKSGAIVFDFDGVIAESVEIKGEAFVELFCQYPQHCKSIWEYHLANGGLSRFEKFRHIYRHILQQELTENEEQRLSNAFSALVVSRVVDCPYVQGAEEAIKHYSREKKIFVVSGTPELEMRTIVMKRGIKEFFSGVFGAPVRKADHVRRIMQEHALSSDDLIFVGDSIEDHHAAEACDVKFIGRVPVGGTNIFQNVHVMGVIQDLYGLQRFIA